MANLGKVQVHVPHTQGPTTEENYLQRTESFNPEYNTESVSFLSCWLSTFEWNPLRSSSRGTGRHISGVLFLPSVEHRPRPP